MSGGFSNSFASRSAERTRRAAAATGALWFCLLLLPATLAAQRAPGDFSDLFAEDRKLYGSDREEKMPVNAVFVEHERWPGHRSTMVFWLFRSTDYPRYASLYFVPFYYNIRSKQDNRRRTFVFPLLYDRVDGPARLTVTPLGLSNRGHGQEFSLYGWLLHFRENGPARHGALLPFLYWGSHAEETSRYLAMFPVFFVDTGPHWTRLNLAGVFDLARDALGLRRLWFAPLLFYARDGPDRTGHGRDGRLIAADFDTDAYSAYLHLPPLYFSGRTVEPSGSSPGGAASSQRTYAWSFAWLYFRSTEQDACCGPRRNSKLLVSTLLVGPVWLKRYSTNPAGANESGATFAVFPLLQNAWSTRESVGDGVRERATSFVWPLSGHTGRRFTDSGGRLIRSESSFWFPILPVFFRTSNTVMEASWTHTWFALWDLVTDEHGIQRFAFVPFVFYRRDSYLALAPFYIRPGPYHADSGFSFGPLHFHSWEPGRDRLWALIYYGSHDGPAQERTRVVFPLYWSFREKQTRSELFLPFYVSHESPRVYYHANLMGLSVTREAGYRASVGADTKAGRVYLDFEVAWLYNLVGFSKRMSAPLPFRKEEPEPEPTIAQADGLVAAERSRRAGGRQDGFEEPRLERSLSVSRDDTLNYTGLDLLYGVFSIRYADTRRHFRLLPLSWLTWDTRSDDRLHVIPPLFVWYQKHLTEYFVLFPLYALQREENGSFVRSVGLLLFIQMYEAEESLREYAYLWPLISLYKSPRRFGGRVVPLAWHRTVNEGAKRTSETITPLFYYERTEERPTAAGRSAPRGSPPELGAKGRSSTIALTWLSYYTRERDNQGHETAHFFALPLFYYGLRSDERGPRHHIFFSGLYLGTGAEETEFSVLYRLFRVRARRSDWRPRPQDEPGHRRKFDLSALFVLFNYETEGSSFGSNHRSETTTWLFPVFWAERTATNRTIGTPRRYYGRRDFSFLSPLLYISSTQSEQDLLSTGSRDVVRRRREEFTFFFPIIPLYYYNREDATVHHNLLWLLDLKYDGGGLRRLAALPVFSYRPNDYIWFFPFYYSSDEQATFFHVVPVFWSFFGRRRGSLFVAGLYLRWEENSSRQNFLYLYDHERKARSESWDALFGFVHFEVAHPTGGLPQREFSLAYRAIMGWNYRSPQYYNVNLLWFYTSREGQEFHSSFLPLYWYESGTNRARLVLPPLLSAFSYEGDDRFEMVALGTLWYRHYDSANRNGRHLLLLGTLYEQVIEPERGYSAVGSFWGFLWQYEREDLTDFRRFSLLKLLFIRTTHEGQTYNRILGIRF